MSWRGWPRVLAYAFLLAVAGAARADLVTDLSERIAQFPVVRAEFVQTKQLAAMKRPLVTRGRMTFSRGAGVLWQIEQPYRMGYVLGAARIVEIAGDGSRRVREAREVPGLAEVGRVFQGVLGADPSALRAQFDVAARGDLRRWTLELTPNDAQVAQVLRGLQLSGSRFVEEVRMAERGGDSTQIVFLHTEGAERLSDAEVALFGAGSR